MQVLVNEPSTGWLEAIVVFLISMLAFKLIKSLVLTRIKNLAQRTETKVDDLVVKLIKAIKPYFYFVGSVLLASQFLVLSEKIEQGLRVTMIVVTLFQAVSLVQLAIDFFADMLLNERDEKAPIKLLKSVVIVVVWVLGIILLLSNLGINVTSLITGLGIGGVAVALAVQNVLKDLLSSISIYLDKPFEIGDFIVVGQDRGTVKEIGIKSTRLLSVKGEELIIPNQDLTSSRIANYKKMEVRRISFTLGVSYETSIDKLEKVPELIERVFASLAETQLVRVHLKELGQSTLNYEILYEVESAEYNDYIENEGRLNLALIKEFNKEKIDLPYPTQRIFVEKK